MNRFHIGLKAISEYNATKQNVSDIEKEIKNIDEQSKRCNND